jgi:hypothetical protein
MDLDAPTLLALYTASHDGHAKDAGDAGETPWAGPLQTADQALGEGDVVGMLRAWNAAYLAAQRSRCWASAVAVGDAALRIGWSTGLHVAFEAEARDAYFLALGRARLQGAIEGVLRVAQGFAALGDDDLVEQRLHLVERLTQSDPAH